MHPQKGVMWAWRKGETLRVMFTGGKQRLRSKKKSPDPLMKPWLRWKLVLLQKKFIFLQSLRPKCWDFRESCGPTAVHTFLITSSVYRQLQLWVFSSFLSSEIKGFILFKLYIYLILIMYSIERAIVRYRTLVQQNALYTVCNELDLGSTSWNS